MGIHLLYETQFTSIYKINADANKFRDEFDKYKNFATSPQKTSEADKLTEEIGKLQVNEIQQKESETSDRKGDESAPSGEGVKEETSKATDDDGAKKCEDSKTKEAQKVKSAAE